MSDTQILKKLQAPHIQTSTLDGHRILGVARKPAAGQTAKTKPRGGLPIETSSPSVQISRPAKIVHTTGTSSAQSSSIRQPPPVPVAVAKAQEARAASAAAAAKPQPSDHLPDYVEPKAPAAGRNKHAPEGPSRGNPQRR